jgi:NAD(P)-dependent dehydrogenase (short-subunit alcohol dehydrogenase family)
MTFLVNHLAPFLLTNLLLEKIQGNKSARIVNVSSDAHKYDTMNFDDLGFKRGYNGMKAYARSKLANILFTYELARRLADHDVTVNALHPGQVATDIWKTNFSIIGPVLKWVMGLFALTPEQGADNSIYLASSPEVEGITGKYFIKREPAQSSPISYDKKIAQRLWEISENLTSLNERANND